MNGARRTSESAFRRGCCALAVTLVSGLVAATAIAQQPPPRWNIAHPLPPQAPAWRTGFQVRWPVRVIGLPSEQRSQTIIVALPTGGQLRPDAADLVAVSSAGQTLPLTVLSHHPAGETIVQFPRVGNEAWYWVYGVAPTGGDASPRPAADDAKFREGMVVEARGWPEGLPQDSWAAVRKGLEAGGPVRASGIVAEVMQRGNPSRPDQPRHFASSYRGVLQIEKEGTYRVVVNGDGATFLFIDGFKVFERTGDPRAIGHIKASELDALAGKVDLTAGAHPFEIHQAVGDNPNSTGSLAFVWSPPGEAKFVPVPATAFARPLYGRVAAAEYPPGIAGASFVQGLDDLLETTGLSLFLVRFEAHGDLPDDQCTWDMGDGTTRRGRSLRHLYFQAGSYDVALQVAGRVVFRKQVHVWPEPGETSPFSLGHAVETLEQMEWQKFPQARVQQMFTFLQACEQPTRWPLLTQVAERLLAQPEVDLETQSLLIAARVEALAAQGQAAEALAYVQEMQPRFAKTPALAVRVALAAAAVQQYHRKDFPAAAAIYKKIMEENSRVEHPNLRLAGVRFGDLYAELGDLDRAGETYRQAAALGGEKVVGEDNPTARGALLRIAEQKLKGGEITATRQLLHKLELDYPGRRLDGLYCFLRAETERMSGRYDEALRHYEMIFRLPQWAGYRDRATFGIADTHLRAGRFADARAWFATLEKTHRALFDERRCAETVQLLDRWQSRGADGGEAKPRLDSFTLNLEPDEVPLWGEMHHGLAVVRGLGMAGRHVALADTYPKEIVYYDWYRPLAGLTPNATYVVEFWWQDLLWSPPPASHQQPYVGFHLIRDGEQGDGIGANANMQHGIPHQWRKATIRIKTPPAEDFRWKIRLNNITGAFVWDRLSLRRASDRELDALTVFQESGKGE